MQRLIHSFHRGLLRFFLNAINYKQGTLASTTHSSAFALKTTSLLTVLPVFYAITGDSVLSCSVAHGSPFLQTPVTVTLPPTARIPSQCHMLYTLCQSNTQFLQKFLHRHQPYSSSMSPTLLVLRVLSKHSSPFAPELSQTKTRAQKLNNPPSFPKSIQPPIWKLLNEFLLNQTHILTVTYFFVILLTPKKIYSNLNNVCSNLNNICVCDYTSV